MRMDDVGGKGVLALVLVTWCVIHVIHVMLPCTHVDAVWLTVMFRCNDNGET